MHAETRILLPSLALGMALSAALANSAGAADELAVPISQQTSLALTVYQQGTALIQDRRTVTLTEGLNRIAFVGVSAALQPETVIVAELGGEPLSLLEQRFEAHILSQRALVEASVGKQIRVAVRNGENAPETYEPATLLAADQGIVVRIGDRIETAPGRLVFDSVPPGLRTQPTLVLALTSLKAGSAPVEIGYLSGGLGWSANYVGELDPSEKHLSLSGRASVANNSGAAYGNARLTLISGSLNITPPSSPRPLPARAAPGVAAAAAPMAAKPEMAPPESIGDFYRYALDRAIGIADHETVQLALFKAPSVPVEKDYRLEDTPNVTEAAADRDATPLPIELRYELVNAKTGGLGMAMPAGIVRLYKRADDGGMVFLGDDHIAEAAIDKKIKLTIGRAFDVTAERRQTSFARPAEQSYIATNEVRLKNARGEPVTVSVYESFSGDWRVLDSSDHHGKASGGSELWRIEVPAHGEHVLSFKVATHY